MCFSLTLCGVCLCLCAWLGGETSETSETLYVFYIGCVALPALNWRLTIDEKTDYGFVVECICCCTFCLMLFYYKRWDDGSFKRLYTIDWIEEKQTQNYIADTYAVVMMRYGKTIRSVWHTDTELIIMHMNGLKNTCLVCK